MADGSIIHTFDKKMWNIPPVHGGRIAGEILGGVVGGALGSYILLIGDPGTDALGTGILFLTGWTFGVPLRVYLVGNLGNETGSLDKTVQGNILGLLGGIIVLSQLSRGSGGEQVIPIELILVGQTIAATIGFNLNRRYKTAPAESETGLINVGAGPLSLATPPIYLRPNPFSGGDLVPTIDVVRMKF